MISDFSEIKMVPNRRVKRSDNIQEALNLQLTATAKRANFGSLVLADDRGLLVASTTKKKVSEQMAALSPKLAPGLNTWHGRVHTNAGKLRLSIAPFRFGEGLLYLSALGGVSSSISRELFMSGLGVSRILNFV